MNKDSIGVGRVLIIAGFALSCFSLILYLWVAFGGPVPLQPKGYRFKVAFDDATTLAKQSDVRIAGVSVGKVVALTRDPQGNRTLATIEIENEFAPPKVDAKAILRQKTLLGETYVEMSLGSPTGAVLADGGRLANGQVADVVEFDELLRIFDRPTRDAFQQWQQTLAAASRGRSVDINNALGNLPVFVEQFGGVVNILDRREEATSSLIRNTGQTFEAISRNEGALQRLIVRQQQVFETLGDRRDAVAATFREFPGFQRESRRTLRRLETFSRDTEPLIRDLEPVLRDARPTLASLRRLAPDLQALFRDLDPLVRVGRTGLPALARVLRGLDPTLRATGPFLEQFNPVLQILEQNQFMVSDFIQQGASALAIKVARPPGNAGEETNGHTLRQAVVTGSQTFPQMERSSDNRGNTYFLNGELAASQNRYKQGFFIYPNFDCVPAGGERRPVTGGAPPQNSPGCTLSEPIPFPGEPLRKYPHVTPAEPSGKNP